MIKFRYFRKFGQILCIFACVFCVSISSALSSNNLPSGYTELEYIQSSGTQYIDTGLKITTNYVKASAKITPLQYNGGSTNQRSWGIQGSSDTCFTAWDKGSSNGHPDGWLALGSSWYVGKSSTTFFNTTLNTSYEFEFTANSGNVSGTYAGENFNTTYSGTVVNSGNIYLFKCDSTFTASKTRIHRFSVETAVGSRNLIPAKRNSDSVLGMYDTVTNTFFTNSGTGSFIAGPVVEIQIATTKYVETAFADSVNELNTTIGTIKSVVDNTIIQADRIGKLYTGKQTRPSDTCPDGAQCLLITEADGSLHWYPICNADGTVGAQIDVSTFFSGFTWYSTYYFRRGRDAGDAQNVTPPAGEYTDTTIQLSAGEWRIKQGNYGIVYGTSEITNYSDALTYNDLNELIGTEGCTCWCKLTAIEKDNIKQDVSGIWFNVYNYSGTASRQISNCSKNCSYNCVSFGVSSLSNLSSYIN